MAQAFFNQVENVSEPANYRFPENIWNFMVSRKILSKIQVKDIIKITFYLKLATLIFTFGWNFFNETITIAPVYSHMQSHLFLQFDVLYQFGSSKMLAKILHFTEISWCKSVVCFNSFSSSEQHTRSRKCPLKLYECINGDHM